MIDRIRMVNFKCFEEQTVSLGHLTVLAGLNGAGKSSVMQALLLLRQSGRRVQSIGRTCLAWRSAHGRLHFGQDGAGNVARSLAATTRCAVVCVP